MDLRVVLTARANQREEPHRSTVLAPLLTNTLLFLLEHSMAPPLTSVPRPPARSQLFLTFS
jgi:hypothetical protein